MVKVRFSSEGRQRFARTLEEAFGRDASYYCAVHAPVEVSPRERVEGWALVMVLGFVAGFLLGLLV